MRAFAAGDIDVLVSTTVIEVGVDVHNATAWCSSTPTGSGSPSSTSCAAGSAAAACRAVPARDLGRGRSAARERLDAVAAHHRRLRAQPGRPRAAPRGRRARRLAVRPPLDPAQPAGAARREDDRRGARGGRALLDADPDARRHPVLAAAVAALEALPRPSSSRSRDAVTRIIGGTAGGRRIQTPTATHPPHQRPGPGGAVQRVESWCGSLHGLRFLDLYAGSGAVGLEAWSRGAGRGDAGRVRPAHRRADRAPTPASSAAERRRRGGTGRRTRCTPRRATTAPSTSCSATRRTRSASDVARRRPRAAAALARPRRAGRGRALAPQPRADLAGRASSATAQALRRDRALVRSRAPDESRSER